MKNKKLGCNYQGSHFGAFYDDACCVDGYLWDLDSSFTAIDGRQYLDIGGDMPCPSCNAKKYVEWRSDYLNEAGYESLVHPSTLQMIKNPLRRYPSNIRRMGKRYWRSGRKQAIQDMKKGIY